MTDRITHDLNAGASWGLEYPVIYGWRPERGTWCAWDRHTGEIHHEFPPDRPLGDTPGAIDFSERRVKALSMPKGYDDEFIDFDGIP